MCCFSKGMPQINKHEHISDKVIFYMNQLDLELGKATSENQTFQQKEKIHLELVSRQNTCAMDVIGLSWIFVDDEI